MVGPILRRVNQNHSYQDCKYRDEPVLVRCCLSRIYFLFFLSQVFFHIFLNKFSNPTNSPTKSEDVGKSQNSKSDSIKYVTRLQILFECYKYLQILQIFIITSFLIYLPKKSWKLLFHQKLIFPKQICKFLILIYKINKITLTFCIFYSTQNKTNYEKLLLMRYCMAYYFILFHLYNGMQIQDIK